MCSQARRVPPAQGGDAPATSRRATCEHVFVRWDNLRIETESAAGEAATLPGYTDDAVVRRFEAPEALDTRFYEVRSKSVLNRVPAASRMPFRWTINPYRGCSHACEFCFARPTHLPFRTSRGLFLPPPFGVCCGL